MAGMVELPGMSDCFAPLADVPSFRQVSLKRTINFKASPGRHHLDHGNGGDGVAQVSWIWVFSS